MTKNKKLLEKFMAQPTSLRFSQIRTLLLERDFLERSGKGSHVIFKKGSCEMVFSFHGKDVKDGYKKMAFSMLKLHNLLLLDD